METILRIRLWHDSFKSNEKPKKRLIVKYDISNMSMGHKRKQSLAYS